MTEAIEKLNKAAQAVIDANNAYIEAMTELAAQMPHEQGKEAMESVGGITSSLLYVNVAMMKVKGQGASE